MLENAILKSRCKVSENPRTLHTCQDLNKWSYCCHPKRVQGNVAVQWTKTKIKNNQPLLDEKDFHSGQGAKNMFFFSLSVMPCICYILEINKSWSTIYAGKICTKKFLKRKWFIQTVICIPTRQGKRLRRENSKVINVAAHERSISIMAHYPFLKDSLAQFDYFWLSFKFLGKVLDWTCIWLI